MPIKRTSDFWPRLLRRLREFGMSDRDIWETLRIDRNTIRYHLGATSVRKDQRAARVMRARVWSRLLCSPYRLTQIEVAEIWGCSNVLVCREVAELRYANPRAA